MTAKRFNRVGGYVYDGDKCISHFEDVAHRDDIVKLLNELHEENENLKDVNVQCCNDYSAMRRDVLRYKEENEQLKQSINNLKDTIIKITIAYQRKYDRNIVDLVDEVHDEDITDLIKELKE